MIASQFQATRFCPVTWAAGPEHPLLIAGAVAVMSCDGCRAVHPHAPYSLAHGDGQAEAARTTAQAEREAREMLAEAGWHLATGPAGRERHLCPSCRPA
jgi:hypothetical protein